jgi:predicted aminopeptidase
VERIRLDNAVLMARRVYLTALDDFDAVLARDGGNLPRAVQDIIAGAKKGKADPFAALKGIIVPR